MSDTTVRMSELLEQEKACEDIKERTATWVAEQQARDNAPQAIMRPFTHPFLRSTLVLPPLPSAGEMEACIKQAPERWQGVVMAAVTLQGRSTEAACDACAQVRDRSTTQELNQFGLTTATELLEHEQERRRLTAQEEIQTAQEHAAKALLRQINDERIRVCVDRAASVINPSMFINPKDTTS